MIDPIWIHKDFRTSILDDHPWLVFLPELDRSHLDRAGDRVRRARCGQRVQDGNAQQRSRRRAFGSEWDPFRSPAGWFILHRVVDGVHYRGDPLTWVSDPNWIDRAEEIRLDMLPIRDGVMSWRYRSRQDRSITRRHDGHLKRLMLKCLRSKWDPKYAFTRCSRTSSLKILEKFFFGKCLQIQKLFVSLQRKPTQKGLWQR